MAQRRLWQKAGVCHSGIQTIERFWNAGISEDGNLCLITDIDEYWYAVYSRTDNKVIWGTRGYPELPSLNKWQKDGFVDIHDRVAKGHYRLFGLGENHPIDVNEKERILIIPDTDSDELVLYDSVTGEEFQRLKYEAFSGDWAFATFSDDLSVIAVIEPYYITFFTQSSVLSPDAQPQ